MGSGAWGKERKRDERGRKGDSCVLSGIPKELYDLNDKRRLGHALCIRHCTCTVIPIKLSTGFSSQRGQRKPYTGNERRAEEEQKNKGSGKIDHTNQTTFSIRWKQTGKTSLTVFHGVRRQEKEKVITRVRWWWWWWRGVDLDILWLQFDVSVLLSRWVCVHSLTGQCRLRARAHTDTHTQGTRHLSFSLHRRDRLSVVWTFRGNS